MGHFGGANGFLPNPPLTRDQVKLMKRGNVVEGKELTLQDLGIGPVPVEEILPTYINPQSQSSCFLTRIYQTPVVARTIVDPALVPGLDWGPPAT